MQQYIDSYNFAGKKAIVRVDFNVPLNDKFEITDDTRIRRAMPTLKKVLEKQGLTRLEGSCLLLGLLAVGSELDGNSEAL